MILQNLLARVRALGHMHKWFNGLNKEFWLGNIFVMLSTVLGVYLAAHSGLKTAVEFERISSDRDNYYLRANLHDEVLYNVEIVEGIIKTIDRLGTFDRSNHPAFQRYVLDTMKEQPNTLKTPNRILGGVLQYYDDIASLLQQRERHLINYPEMADKMRQRIAEFRKNTLSLMETDLQSLRQRLEDADVVVY